MRTHLYLILNNAMLYGKDIDDEARVPEMAEWWRHGVAVGVPSWLTLWGSIPWSLWPPGVWRP